MEIVGNRRTVLKRLDIVQRGKKKKVGNLLEGKMEKRVNMRGGSGRQEKLLGGKGKKKFIKDKGRV